MQIVLKRFAHSLLGLSMIGAVIGAAAPAQAVAITSGTSFTESWDLAISGHPDVMATAAFSNFTFLSGNQVAFILDVTNTTSNSGTGSYSDARLTSLGWDTSPVATAVADSTSVFASVTNQSITSDHVDVCFFSGPNCSGGGNGGLEAANLAGLHGDPSTTGDFLVILTFGAIVPPLDFDKFFGKFQTSAGSVEGFSTTVPPNPVPEPATLALFGAGLIGLVVLRRRRAIASRFVALQ
jgi:hypothetical protein